MELKLFALGFLHLAIAMPAITLHDLEMVDDTMSVGSYVREARAAPPENFHKTYQSEGDGEIGYSRKKTGGGKKGYQHFDSYHKKAGDNYELETQDSYGLDDEGHDGAHSHPQEKRERYREEEPEAEDEEREKVEKSANDHEELRDGPHDGNGGVEAVGHDPADYVLPEKYTYGTGDEYNF
ncbi:uncharacterized protein LOC126781620 [Nymphalis io]|uniref:uncharacterized protein LOC126781620 n=1 Tax=Inachis io TaxID=171585 RepID=UPI002168461E|nr:uncharacterized protein LOC126781620 [Nymphalis io]XP_050362507.1 uncharacterized protein LOC126781620 [Nymphalis io]